MFPPERSFQMYFRKYTLKLDKETYFFGVETD